MKTLEEIHQIREQKRKELDLRVNIKADTREKHILVCHGTGCTSSKSPQILENFRKILKEKNIDITEEFEVEHNKKKYIFSIGKVVDFIKLIDVKEQSHIKSMIETIDKTNGNVVDYFKCLSTAIINTYKVENIEENEETM